MTAEPDFGLIMLMFWVVFISFRSSPRGKKSSVHDRKETEQKLMFSFFFDNNLKIKT